jgi:S1-C subfamily serine protease
MRKILCAAVVAAMALAFGVSTADAIDPGTFAEVASGIVLVRADCAAGTSTGTGFLVGSRVVMTARHVVKGCRNTRIHTSKGEWIRVRSIIPWSEADRSDIDVATLRLARDASGWVFHLRPNQAPIGVNVAAIGHPLGADIAVTQGKILLRTHRQVFVRLLGAEGASGSPFVDNAGNVIAILQQGYGSADAIGQRTAGVVSGYDFSSRWAAWRRALCKAYPYGGVADCA